MNTEVASPALTPFSGASAGPRLAVSLLALALLFSGLLALPARAADDSNSGQLAQTPPVSAQDLNSALNSLAQGTNDTQLQQELSQLEAQMSSGNYSRAASTLISLQNLANTDSSTPDSLRALLQSLSIGGSGASINPNTLASILSQKPYGSSNESPQKLSVDMQTLANLMKNVDPSFATSLLQNSTLLSQSAFGGAGGLGGGGQVPLPGASSFGGLPIPSVGAPSLSVGGPGASLPAVSPGEFAVPLLVALAAVALYVSRNRVAALVGSQDLPGLSRLRTLRAEDASDFVIPSDPRRRIEFYFGRAVRLMGRRGVPKPDHETHREFTSRVDARPEEPQVKTISSLYEKAKFSGQEVGSPDADRAAAAYSQMGAEDR